MQRRAQILRVLVSGILTLVWSQPPSILAQAPAVPPVPSGAAKLEGRIFLRDGKTPVPGAIVRVCYLEGGAVRASAATSHKGEYEIPALPHGYADLNVETPDGAFLASQVVNLLPAGKLVVDLALVKYTERPATWWGDREKKPTAPCSSQSPVGSAEVRQSAGAGEFLKSPKGIAILAGGAAAVLLAISAGGGEIMASPSAP